MVCAACGTALDPDEPAAIRGRVAALGGPMSDAQLAQFCVRLGLPDNADAFDVDLCRGCAEQALTWANVD